MIMPNSKIRLLLQLFLLFQSSLSTVVKVGYSIVEDTGSVDDSPLEPKDFVQYNEKCDDRCCWTSYKDRCHFTGYHLVANAYTTHVISQDDQTVIECNKRYHKYHHHGSCKGGRFEGETKIYDIVPDEEDGEIVLETAKDCDLFGICNACVTNEGRILFNENETCHVLDGFYQIDRDFGSSPCDDVVSSPAPLSSMAPSTVQGPDIPSTNVSSEPTPSFTPQPQPIAPPTLSTSAPSPPVDASTSAPTPTVVTSPPTPSPIPAVPTIPGGVNTPAPTCSISNDAEPCVAQT